MINFRVSGDGHDELQVTAGPRDILKWEATFQGASLASYLQGLRLTELYQIAWVTLAKQGHPLGALTFKEFLDQAEVWFGHPVEADEQSDPTQPAV